MNEYSAKALQANARCLYTFSSSVVPTALMAMLQRAIRDTISDTIHLANGIATDRFTRFRQCRKSAPEPLQARTRRRTSKCWNMRRASRPWIFTSRCWQQIIVFQQTTLRATRLWKRPARPSTNGPSAGFAPKATSLQDTSTNSEQELDQCHSNRARSGVMGQNGYEEGA